MVVSPLVTVAASVPAATLALPAISVVVIPVVEILPAGTVGKETVLHLAVLEESEAVGAESAVYEGVIVHELVAGVVQHDAASAVFVEQVPVDVLILSKVVHVEAVGRAVHGVHLKEHIISYGVVAGAADGVPGVDDAEVLSGRHHVVEDIVLDLAQHPEVDSPVGAVSEYIVGDFRTDGAVRDGLIVEDLREAVVVDIVVVDHDVIGFQRGPVIRHSEQDAMAYELGEFTSLYSEIIGGASRGNRFIDSSYSASVDGDVF